MLLVSLAVMFLLRKSDVMCSTHAPPRTSLAVGEHHAQSAHHVPRSGTQRSKNEKFLSKLVVFCWWSIRNHRRTYGRAQKLYVCTDRILELGAELLGWWRRRGSPGDCRHRHAPVLFARPPEEQNSLTRTGLFDPLLTVTKLKKAAPKVLPSLIGGDGEDRTLDLMTASHALSQLSYAPE